MCGNVTKEVSCTCLDDLLCHGHHFVCDRSYAECLPRGWRASPVMALQSKASHSIEDVCRWELEMNCGAVGVIYDCRQEGFLSWNVKGTSRGQEDIMRGEAVSLQLTGIKITLKENICVSYSQLSQHLIPIGNPGWSEKSGKRLPVFPPAF